MKTSLSKSHQIFMEYFNSARMVRLKKCTAELVILKVIYEIYLYKEINDV